MDQTRWDIVLAGAGLSGLTLAIECARRPFFRNCQILLIDRDDKVQNDRTWCFWATDEEMRNLPPVVSGQWTHGLFFGQHFNAQLDMAPYQYRMIRGLDFYRWAQKELSQYTNIQHIKTNIRAVEPGLVRTDTGVYQGEYIVNSALTAIPVLPPASDMYLHPPLTAIRAVGRPAGFTYLLQHFKGWMIETPTPAFDRRVMTFMDYRLEQKGETRFVYVLPLTERQALVEFTVFSPALCPAAEYDAILDNYIKKTLEINEFRILETEFGVIPMSDYPFAQQTDRSLVHMGTAGGFVKASSGYAFKRTHRKIRAFAADWEKNGRPDPSLLRSGWRYRFYDSVMLRVLRENAVPGKAFFTGLFKKLPASLVFRFLDEDSTFADDLHLLSAPPTWPFLKTALRQIPVFFRI